MGVNEVNRRDFLRYVAGGAATAALPWRGLLAAEGEAPAGRPNIILCMTDDQGWGDTSYSGHPHLKTPNLDAMTANGIRFERFYAAAPVCSPTRGSVLTGRHPNRFGCFSHGYPIRREEVTIAQALKQAGYATGHFGKWHLNGKTGVGRPILANDPLSPAKVGFDEWLSAHNFFDLDPAFGRNGVPEQFKGDGSDIIMDEALKFIAANAERNQPFLAVVWYGSPHNPHQALEQDREPYKGRPAREQNYYGELTAVDRSMGRLRAELRRLGIADNTLVWYTSDNGGNFGPTSTGGLRGSKATLWEGGVRVPGIIEWPSRVPKPVVTAVPANTCDIYPTLVDLLGIEVKGQVLPLDGVSLAPLIAGKMAERPKAMPFWVTTRGAKGGHAALIDGRWKLHLNPALSSRGGTATRPAAPDLLLYDLAADAREQTDLTEREPDRVRAMRAALEQWQESVRNSLAGKDYQAD